MTKTILITGASKGIGYETAKRFLHEDNDVSTLLLLARPSSAFEETLRELEAENKKGKTLIPYYVDLADRAQLLNCLEEVKQLGKNVDLLINNAGYTNPVAIQQIEIEDFERTLDVNLLAPFLIVQTLLRGGNRFEFIVNIASTAGMNGRSGWLTYSASKAGVIVMSEVMKAELAIFGTRVVCISPGRCATDLRKKLAPDEDPSTIMQPSHVASVIEALYSDVGRFLDSQNLVVRM